MNSKHKQIGLLGATGMVGTGFAHMVETSPHRLRAFPRSEFDILSNSIDTLNLDGCDVVVNLAGMTNRMMINSKSEASGDICNSVFPQILARKCSLLKIPLIHLSTDCVFSGGIGPHTENATPDATDPYGVSKIKGECPELSMVVRTSIIGPEQKNFNSLFCWFLSQKNTCDGFVNHLWNGVTNIQFAKKLSKIIKEEKRNKFPEIDLIKNPLMSVSDIMTHHGFYKDGDDSDPKLPKNDSKKPENYMKNTTNVAHFQLVQFFRIVFIFSDQYGIWHFNFARECSRKF